MTVTGHMLDHPTEQISRGLATAVEGALWKFAPIRQSLTLVDVHNNGDGGIRLTGNIRSDTLKAIATRIALGVAGVTTVDDQLVSDSVLESDIALAVANDPDTMLCTDVLTISALLGTIYLGGIVAREDLSEAQRLHQRVEDLTRDMPGVVDIVNRIRAVQGSGTTYVVEAAEVVADEPTTSGARAMGSLIPEEQREKIRAMIKARAGSAG